MVMEGFLQDVICALAEPSLLVDREKRIVFATKSFEALIGESCRTVHKCKCTQFVVPSLSGQNSKDACCWDVLDIYLDKGRGALWPLTKQDGSVLPTLCTVSPIRIGSTPSLIAIFVKPLLGGPAKSSLDFFQEVRRNLGTLGTYEEWVRGYLRKNHTIKQIIWLDTSSTATTLNSNSLEEQLTETAIATQSKIPTGFPFDIVVQAGRGHDIFHLFPSANATQGKILAVQAIGQLDEPTVCELLAVMAATVTQPANDQLNWLRISIQGAFSVRENQILALVTRGMSDKEIALHLNLSRHTVSNHVRHMMDKTGVKKRTQLVILR